VLLDPLAGTFASEYAVAVGILGQGRHPPLTGPALAQQRDNHGPPPWAVAGAGVAEIIPDVPLLPGARALLVVGSHADRRAVQARARAAGKKIFYLDPEGFHANGMFMPYPLESPQTGDWVCRRTAAEGLPALARMLRRAQVKLSAPPVSRQP
jgi:hypothetical protein